MRLRAIGDNPSRPSITARRPRQSVNKKHATVPTLSCTEGTRRLCHRESHNSEEVGTMNDKSRLRALVSDEVGSIVARLRCAIEDLEAASASQRWLGAALAQ